MKRDKSIFGFRFGSDENLSPTEEELRAFIESPKKKGGKERHADDLAAYYELLENVKVFERRERGATQLNFGDTMFYGVLGLSQFVNSALPAEVERYKYCLHELVSLDFRKPEAFVQSAEEEMGRLNPKKKDDAAKLHKLRGMVDERRGTLETLNRRRTALGKELGNIAWYVRDNLVKIEKLCETSIVVLVDLLLSRKKEGQLIEDVKMHFKEQLRDAIRRGPIAKERLEAIRREVDVLAKELSACVREDVYAWTDLFESIHDRARGIASGLAAQLATTEGNKSRSFGEECELFSEIEKTLVALVSEYRFEVKTADIGFETAYRDIFLEKRKELLEYIFEVLEKDRRSRTDRRSAANRRKSANPITREPQRRSGKDRRAKKSRRKALALSTEQRA